MKNNMRIALNMGMEGYGKEAGLGKGNGKD